MGSKNYSTSVDIWSVGCIFAEIVTRKPLFAGQNEEEQLQKIFKIRGTPNENDWSGLKELPLYPTGEQPIYQPQDLANFVPLDEQGLDLLDKMLRCNPAERITAK